MAWFQRDHTGRPLLRFERDLVTALGGLLAELAAPQIDENETALTAEGSGCLIALVPHRSLGGISLVVSLANDKADVSWAQVGSLDYTHDDLDSGIWVANFPFDRTRPDFGPVLECVRRQVNEPLTLRHFGADRALVLVHDEKNSLREVGRLGNRFGWSGLLRRAPPTHETKIRLTDSAPPSLTEPSGVDAWFASGGSSVAAGLDMFHELRQILEKSRARRREPGLDVWLLDSGPWWRFNDFRGLEQTKESILAAAWRLPCPLFLIPEEPIDSELQPFVRREGEAWRVDTTKSADEFYRAAPTSVLGNWLLYAAAEPLATRPPDTFRTKPETLLAFMAHHIVLLVIDAFHDNTEWCVAMRAPSDEHG